RRKLARTRRILLALAVASHQDGAAHGGREARHRRIGRHRLSEDHARQEILPRALGSTHASRHRTRRAWLPVCTLMERDRRSAPRARVKLSARWEGVLSRENATVSDLSRSGCFVLTGGKVEVKEVVWVEIPLTDQPKVNFLAQVGN